MSTITHETPNGVDVARLTETVGAISQDPTLVGFRLRATNFVENGRRWCWPGPPALSAIAELLSDRRDIQ